MASEDLDRSPDREALALWLDASPANRQAWDKAQRMWDVFDDAQDSDLIAAMARAARQARPTPAAKPLWALARRRVGGNRHSLDSARGRRPERMVRQIRRANAGG
jgi:ferric-dicitrate binding protein FerR (iron transport regulator)